jgi:mannose-1-phosphate guanylyltransferase
MNSNYVVIMAGGVGSRFWPASRTSFPKQFLDILGIGKTLLQQTFERFDGICPKENIFIVTNEIYRDLIKEQLPEIKDQQILGEPMMRNTAPCIAYACSKIFKIDPKAQIVVAPADHLILKENLFKEIILDALSLASKEDYLITLGIVPSRPDTGYGYIQYNEALKKEKAYKVKTFTEKPNLELAITFLKSGDFLWNAGIFIWSAESILKSFEINLPDMIDIFREGRSYLNTSRETEFIKGVYGRCTNISIDYGILEKAQNVYVIPSDFGWSDLGTWGSVYELKEKDNEGNVVLGDQKLILKESSDCIVSMPSDKIVVIYGLHDYIVVESNHSLLICPKNHEQEIKALVAEVKENFGKNYV